jgi:hypothetical protein
VASLAERGEVPPAAVALVAVEVVDGEDAVDTAIRRQSHARSVCEVDDDAAGIQGVDAADRLACDRDHSSLASLACGMSAANGRALDLGFGHDPAATIDQDIWRVDQVVLQAASYDLGFGSAALVKLELDNQVYAGVVSHLKVLLLV